MLDLEPLFDVSALSGLAATLGYVFKIMRVVSIVFVNYSPYPVFGTCIRGWMQKEW